MKPFNGLVCLHGKHRNLWQEDFFYKDILQINILVILFRSKYYDDFFILVKQKAEKHLFKFQKLYVITHYLFILLIYERGELKSLPLTVVLSLYGSVISCFIYFDTMLLGAYKFKILSSWYIKFLSTLNVSHYLQ